MPAFRGLYLVEDVYMPAFRGLYIYTSWRMSICQPSEVYTSWRMSICQPSEVYTSWRMSICQLSEVYTSWRMSICQPSEVYTSALLMSIEYQGQLNMDKLRTPMDRNYVSQYQKTYVIQTQTTMSSVTYSIQVELALCIALIHCTIRTWMYSMRHRLQPRFLVQYLAMSYDIRRC